jgi:hypothetical protein
MPHRWRSEKTETAQFRRVFHRGRCYHAAKKEQQQRLSGRWSKYGFDVRTRQSARCPEIRSWKWEIEY